MGLRTPLSAEQVKGRLADTGWSGDTAQISRSFPVDYDTAIQSVGEVGVAAIELEHRPDIDIRWDVLRFAMTTHTADDVVTELDFQLAERINAIAASHGVGLSTTCQPLGVRADGRSGDRDAADGGARR